MRVSSSCRTPSHFYTLLNFCLWGSDNSRAIIFLIILFPGQSSAEPGDCRRMTRYEGIMQQNIDLWGSQCCPYLRDAVIYQSGLDGHVAAHPIIHTRPVLPQRMSIVLDSAALHTEPGKQVFRVGPELDIWTAHLIVLRRLSCSEM